MVETVFSVLFLATLALPTLALALGAIVLAWPVRKSPRPFAATRHLAVHS